MHTRTRRLGQLAAIVVGALAIGPLLLPDISIGVWWPFAGLGLFVCLFMAAAYTGILGTISSNLELALRQQPVYGIGIALVISTVLFLLGGTVVYGLRPWLQTELGTPFIITHAFALTIALLAFVPIVRLYRKTGLAFDPENQRKGSWVLAALIWVVVGFVTLNQPNRFFDPETGDPAVMLDASTGQLVYRDPQECTNNKGVVTKCFSSVTGQPLVVPTRKELEEFRRESWLKRVKALIEPWISESRASRTERTKPQHPPIRKLQLKPGEEKYYTIPEGSCKPFTAMNPDGNVFSWRKVGSDEPLPPRADPEGDTFVFEDAKHPTTIFYWEAPNGSSWCEVGRLISAVAHRS